MSFHLNNSPKRQDIFFNFRDEETGTEVSWVAQGHPILSGRAGTQTDQGARDPALQLQRLHSRPEAGVLFGAAFPFL